MESNAPDAVWDGQGRERDDTDRFVKTLVKLTRREASWSFIEPPSAVPFIAGTAASELTHLYTGETNRSPCTIGTLGM